MFLPLLFALCVPVFALDDSAPGILEKLGHSHIGEAFDTGPREKPWVMEGIGVAHFPITTKNPEVQKWFDQGNALLHSFWDYEAERAFEQAAPKATDHEQRYIRASTEQQNKKGEEATQVFIKEMETVEARYPDDLQAKLLPARAIRARARFTGRRCCAACCTIIPTTPP